MMICNGAPVLQRQPTWNKEASSKTRVPIINRVYKQSDLENSNLTKKIRKR